MKKGGRRGEASSSKTSVPNQKRNLKSNVLVFVWHRNEFTCKICDKHVWNEISILSSQSHLWGNATITHSLAALVKQRALEIKTNQHFKVSASVIRMNHTHHLNRPSAGHLNCWQQQQPQPQPHTNCRCAVCNSLFKNALKVIPCGVYQLFIVWIEHTFILERKEMKKGKEKKTNRESFNAKFEPTFNPN